MHDLGGNRRALDDGRRRSAIVVAARRFRPANAQAADGFSFLQISDSHIGFKAPANPNPLATLDEAIAKIGALPRSPPS